MAYNSKRSRIAAAGFTLIELLVALGILSALTLGVVQAIQRAFKNKKRIEMLNDHQTHLRDAMDVMVQDIKFAFHYRDFNQEIEKEVQKKIKELQAKKKKNNAPGSTPTPATPATPAEPEEPVKDTSTHFKGSNDELHLVSLNLPRTRANQATADYAEVGYRVDSCKSRSDFRRETKCLIRRIAPVVDDDVTKGGKETALLEDVTKLEFQYYGIGKFDWVKEWKTFETSDDFTKGRYPEMIKVTLEVAFPIPKSDKTKKYVRSRVVPILFPNNPSEEEMMGESGFEEGLGEGDGTEGEADGG